MTDELSNTAIIVFNTFLTVQGIFGFSNSTAGFREVKSSILKVK